MKLQDKETLSIAKAVSGVLENWPAPLYSPEGKKVQAKSKEEHEELKKKGYTYGKSEVKEVDEPVAKDEKKFKAKHVVKKSGATEAGKGVKEGPVIWLDEPDEIQTEAEEEPKEEESDKQKKYQAFFKKALAKFGVKSPAELEGNKKKEFFDYVDKNYKSDDE